MNPTEALAKLFGAGIAVQVEKQRAKIDKELAKAEKPSK